MKSPAYYTKHGQTHVKCGVKKDFLCNTKAEIFPIKAVDNTDISILSAYTKCLYYKYIKTNRL